VPALAGRSTIVTGASSGIGAAIARRCADEGSRVLAVGRDEERLAATVAHAPDLITPCIADLTEAGAGEACVRAALDAHGGRLDGLVHAAGTVLRNEDPAATTDETFDRIIDENLGAAFRLVRAALPALAEAGDAAIVLCGSQLAHIGIAGYASYSAAKGGVTALSRALAVQVGPQGVRVNVLAPGVVKTPMAYVDREDFDEREATIAGMHPLRRIGQPEDMAGPAVFLLSADSAWMTGQVLHVDGGWTAQ
jgi:NAD(P)-dependent dehydrogenase (short-subunit alcohol dehydrogenase family)